MECLTGNRLLSFAGFMLALLGTTPSAQARVRSTKVLIKAALKGGVGKATMDREKSTIRLDIGNRSATELKHTEFVVKKGRITGSTIRSGRLEGTPGTADPSHPALARRVLRQGAKALFTPAGSKRTNRGQEHTVHLNPPDIIRVFSSRDFFIGPRGGVRVVHPK
jgi:hypothetical protein